jgi:quercetin dioxygenase-like cupin family protein
MSLTRRFSIAVASVSVAGVLFATTVLTQHAHVLVPADKVQWGPGPPHLPAGVEAAVLEGNPKEKGPVTLRLRFPANYAIPAHSHTMTERVTVMSGTFNVGMGERLDRSASQALEPGSYVSLPGGMNHFAWTTVPTVVQIALEGPFDITYVNPADNPMTKTSSTKR